MSLTAKKLRELLHYDPQTGLFTRLVQTSNRVKVGDTAGTSWRRKQVPRHFCNSDGSTSSLPQSKTKYHEGCTI